MSLKERTIQGLSWSFVNNFSLQIINLVTGIVLARLLSPREFGLIGMLTIFIALSNVLINSGIVDALIRDPRIKDEDYSTAFIFNIAVSSVIYVILYLTAPWISDFYEEPQLKPMVRVLSLSLVINAFMLIHRTRLIKAINFKLLTRIDVVAVIISGMIAIGMAWYGYGVWSLVFQTILTNLFTVSLCWFWVEWRPSFVFNVASFRKMFSFGSKLALLGIIDTLFLNMYYLIIGKVYSAHQLGFYTQAERFKNFPSQGVTRIVQQVTYPVFSEIQINEDRLRESYIKLNKIVSLISITLLFGLAAVSDNLILILLGPEWAKTGDFLEILCFIAIFYPLNALNQNIMKVKGKSTMVLNLGIIKKINAIPVILAAVFISIKAMLLFMILQHFLAFCINAYYGGGLIKYRVWGQLKDILPPVLVSGVMYVLIQVLSTNIEWAPIPLLIVQVLTGGLVAILLYELLSIDGYIHLRNEIKNKIM